MSESAYIAFTANKTSSFNESSGTWHFQCGTKTRFGFRVLLDLKFFRILIQAESNRSIIGSKIIHNNLGKLNIFEYTAFEHIFVTNLCKQGDLCCIFVKT